MLARMCNNGSTGRAERRSPRKDFPMNAPEALAKAKELGGQAAYDQVHAAGLDDKFHALVEEAFPGPVHIWVNVVASNGFDYSQFLGNLYDAWSQGHLEAYYEGAFS